MDGVEIYFILDLADGGAKSSLGLLFLSFCIYDAAQRPSKARPLNLRDQLKDPFLSCFSQGGDTNK